MTIEASNDDGNVNFQVQDDSDAELLDDVVGGRVGGCQKPCPIGMVTMGNETTSISMHLATRKPLSYFELFYEDELIW